MSDQNRVGGTIYFKVNGSIYSAKGDFTYNLGIPKREAVVGADGVHGYKEVQQQAFIEGEITDNQGVSLADLAATTNSTVTLELANGKTISLRDAWYAGEGTGHSEEGNIGCRFESKNQGEEIGP